MTGTDQAASHPSGPSGSILRLLDRVARPLACLAVFGSAWTIVVWLLLWWPYADVAALVPAARRWSTLYLWFTLTLCIAYRIVFELDAGALKPNANSLEARPSIVPALLSYRAGALYPLSWITSGYAALLWLSWWRGWQAVPSPVHTLAYAALNTATGVAAYAYGMRIAWRGCAMHSGANQQEPSASAAAGASPAQVPRALQFDEHSPVQAQEPRVNFSSVHGMARLKQEMIAAAEEILMPRGETREPPRNGILMHGEPGNGKTMFAEALAGELAIPFVTMTYGDVSSKWINEMPRIISRCFRYVKDLGPCVFLIDEIDGFLRSREAMSVGEDLKVANTMLTEIVRLRDHQVILVAATNYLSMLDAAAVREGRFDFKIEIPAPDEQARIAILRHELARRAGQVELEESALAAVARRWSGFSVSRLVAVVRALAASTAQGDVQRIGFAQWEAALRAVQGSRGRMPSSSLRLQDLLLPAESAQRLELLAQRLRDVYSAELLGAELPRGVLLYGPPGTGKTAAAQALALACDWAFLPTMGADLGADREALGRLYRQACDLRPAIVFIDEAEDLLRDRQISASPDPVSRLLTLLDGAVEGTCDVLFIAATNHPSQIDPALVRPGRFTEKIGLGVPSASQLGRAVSAWLRRKGAQLEAGLEPAHIAHALDGRTVADVNGVLQYALNRAVCEDGRQCHPVRICAEDVDAAIATVLA